MKILTKIIVVVLLAINGLTATYGGISLMVHPDGSGLGLPLELLQDTPFGNYFIPGLLLLLTNGFSSLFIGWLFITAKHNSYWLIKVQGLLLISYIGIQVMMIDVVVPLHVICGGTGLLMIILGYLCERPAKKFMIP
jgi:hypothetical protein